MFGTIHMQDAFHYVAARLATSALHAQQREEIRAPP
jgi:hypothetical protein